MQDTDIEASDAEAGGVPQAQNGLSEAPAQQDGGSPKDESEPPTVAEEEAEPDAAIGQPAFDPAFAPLSAPFMFWQDALLLALLGGCMGAFGYGFLKAITEVTQLWMSADGNAAYPAASTLGFGAGRAWWVGLCAGGGLVVGLAKAALRLDAAPSFITELRGMHTDPVQGAKVALCTLLSMLAGVPMGPEAGLGAASGAVGVLLGTRLRSFKVQGSVRRKLYVLSAMCSAFAGLLPNPMAALLLALELGRPGQALEGLQPIALITLLAAGATASFVVYYAIAGYTYLRPLYTGLSVEAAIQYDQLFIVEGVLFGVMGAALGLAYLLTAGLVKAAIAPLRAALDRSCGRWPRVVALATLGGALTGVLGWAMPLTLTDGAAQLGPIFMSGGAIGSGVLAASCFAKGLAYHIAAECGFHGGLFLPMLSMGAMLGQVFVNETGVDPFVAQSCSLIALGAAVAPAPFFLAVLSMSCLAVGPAGLVPIFATATAAHLFCMGLGAPQALVAAALRRARKSVSRK